MGRRSTRFRHLAIAPVVLVVVALFMSALVCGCTSRPKESAPPSPNGSLVGEVSGTGRRGWSVSLTEMEYEYQFTLDWRSGRRPRQTDFLITDATKLTIDGRPVTGDREARSAALDEVRLDWKASVSYETTAGASSRLGDVDYPYPAATAVTIAR